MDLEALNLAHDHATQFLRDISERDVAPVAGVDQLRKELGGPLPQEPTDPSEVIERLVAGAEPGLMGIPSPRFFGFVIGGATPASVAADWLTSAWDQNAGLYAAGPAASVVEEVAGAWLLELFGLSPTSSYGFVTGATMANFTGLAAAREHVLRKAGWDVGRDGLIGAPPVTLIAGAERHVTVDVALRYLGLGPGRIRVVPADEQGRMTLGGTRDALAQAEGPTIVIAQAGNVNSGAFDPIDGIVDAAHEQDAWVHVDGAFGLWAALSPRLQHLTAGIERVDSLSTDGHKWLNVPYDSGFVFCAHPESHRAAMSVAASYLMQAESERDQMDWTPEFSRRARGFSVWAAISALGRSGLVEMVERTCACASRFAERLGDVPGVEVLNDVVLNQVLVRFLAEDGDHDRRTRDVIAAVQRDGTCWLAGSVWHGKAVMRISVSNWQTTIDDVDRSVDAILRAAAT